LTCDDKDDNDDDDDNDNDDDDDDVTKSYMIDLRLVKLRSRQQ
jgi:hypothetical protein